MQPGICSGVHTWILKLMGYMPWYEKKVLNECLHQCCTYSIHLLSVAAVHNKTSPGNTRMLLKRLQHGYLYEKNMYSHENKVRHLFFYLKKTHTKMWFNFFQASEDLKLSFRAFLVVLYLFYV